MVSRNNEVPFFWMKSSKKNEWNIVYNWLRSSHLGNGRKYLVSPLNTYKSDIIGTSSTSIKAQKRENISQKRFELEWGG